MHKSEVERFIDFVRLRPYLYDRNNEHYKDNKMKQTAWTDIAKEFSLSDKKAALNRWQRIRDNFREALRRQTYLRKGQIAIQLTKYKLQSQLSFLIPYLTTREINEKPGDQEACGAAMKKKKDLNHQRKNRTIRIKKTPHRLDKFFKTMCEMTKEMPEFNQSEVEKMITDIVNDAKQSRFGSSVPHSAEHLNNSEKYIDSNEEDFHYFKSLMPYMNRLTPLKKLLVRTEFQNILYREMKNPHEDALYSDNATSFISSTSPIIQTYDTASGNAAKAQWRSLRNCFNDALKKQTFIRKGQIALQLGNYKYHDQLSFLTPFFTTRDSSQISSDGQQKQKKDVEKRPRRARAKKSTHRLDDFFNSICETTKQLPESSQLEIERLITEVVNNAKEGHFQSSINSQTVENLDSKSYNDKHIDVDGEDFHYFKSLMPYMNKLMPLKKLLIRTEFQNILFREMKNSRDDVMYPNNVTSFISTALPIMETYHSAPGTSFL